MDTLDIHPRVGLGAFHLGATALELGKALASLPAGPCRLRDPALIEGNSGDTLWLDGYQLIFDASDGSNPLDDALLTRIVVDRDRDALLYGQPWTAWTREALVEQWNRRKLPQTVSASATGIQCEGMTVEFDERGHARWLDLQAHTRLELAWHVKPSGAGAFVGKLLGQERAGANKVTNPSGADLAQALAAIIRTPGWLRLSAVQVDDPLQRALAIDSEPKNAAFHITLGEEHEHDHEVRSFNGAGDPKRKLEVQGHEWPVTQLCFDTLVLRAIVREFLARGDVARLLLS